MRWRKNEDVGETGSSGGGDGGWGCSSVWTPAHTHSISTGNAYLFSVAIIMLYNEVLQHI